MVFNVMTAILAVSLIGLARGDGLGTEFFLYSENKDREPLNRLNITSIASSQFDPCRKTAFLITGWRQKRSTPDIIRFIRRFSLASFNAILVDYDTNDYILAPFVAGQDVADFIRTMVEVTGVHRKHITLVGLSLGAHVAAHASKMYRIGRIVALDPSGPLYDFLPPLLRLHRTDADLVQAVHSSITMGSLNPFVGHVNYVVNDGIYQPGCGTDQYCTHLRSIWLFAASLDDCTLRFRQCHSYLGMILGLCKKKSTIPFGLGLSFEDVPDNRFQLYFYVTRHTKYPYCNEPDQLPPTYDTKVC